MTEREQSSVRWCVFHKKLVPHTFVHYSEKGETLHLCEECSQRADTNGEMIALAELIQEEVKGRCYEHLGFEFVESEAVPSGNIYLVPSRETLEKVQEEDPLADLRRYFGVIKNVGL